jgi:molecular chaperone GrpE (heat shock protein)
LATFNYFPDKHAEFPEEAGEKNLNQESQQKLEELQTDTDALVQEEEVIQRKIKELKVAKKNLRTKRQSMKKNFSKGCLDFKDLFQNFLKKRGLEFFEKINYSKQTPEGLANFANQLYRLYSYKKVFDALKQNWNMTKFRFKLLRNFSKLFKPIMEDKMQGNIFFECLP